MRLKQNVYVPKSLFKDFLCCLTVSYCVFCSHGENNGEVCSPKVIKLWLI